jgi:iron-sulfur cluster repair protein YtfE (RIC family)
MVGLFPPLVRQVTACGARLAKLFDDLAQHVHLEEEVLFPMFDVRPAS